MALTGIKKILEWQNRFRQQPEVWASIFEGEVSNLYDSKEAAQFEVDFCKSGSVCKFNVHSLELSRERWGWNATTEKRICSFPGCEIVLADDSPGCSGHWVGGMP